MAGAGGHEGEHRSGGERYRLAADALRNRMVRRIVADGGLADPAWRAAFREVPRHLFVAEEEAEPPDAGDAEGRDGGDGGFEGTGQDDGGGPDGPAALPSGGDLRWRLRELAGMYADRPIPTRVVGGELVSSSSQPSLMALMCEALEVADGDRVLEIGTGTGYNAALLAHRLGPGAVTTIDLDRELTDAARERLDLYGTEAARSVVVVTGDGALGHPDRAPYDRIMATCEMPEIPAPWLAQVRPGGRVLAPFATGLVLLTVRGPDMAEGRFLATPAFFVALRGQAAGGPHGGLGRRLFGVGPGADRTRYGLTVRGGRQWVWRDDPEGPDTWDID